jgi:hypothetical protein
MTGVLAGLATAVMSRRPALQSLTLKRQVLAGEKQLVVVVTGTFVGQPSGSGSSLRIGAGCTTCRRRLPGVAADSDELSRWSSR